MLMSRVFFTALLVVPVFTVAQQPSANPAAAAKASPAKPTPRTADGHADLNGVWSTAGGISSVFRSEKKEDGSIQIKGGDQFYIFTNKRPAGPPPSAAAQNVPSYRLSLPKK